MSPFGDRRPVGPSENTDIELRGAQITQSPAVIGSRLQDSQNQPVTVTINNGGMAMPQHNASGDATESHQDRPPSGNPEDPETRKVASRSMHRRVILKRVLISVLMIIIVVLVATLPPLGKAGMLSPGSEATSTVELSASSSCCGPGPPATPAASASPASSSTAGAQARDPTQSTAPSSAATTPAPEGGGLAPGKHCTADAQCAHGNPCYTTESGLGYCCGTMISGCPGSPCTMNTCLDPYGCRTEARTCCGLAPYTILVGSTCYSA